MAHTLEDYLTDIHMEMRRRNLPEMDDDTVRELSKHLQHPKVMQGFQTGQLTAQRVVDEVQEALRGMGVGKADAFFEPGRIEGADFRHPILNPIDRKEFLPMAGLMTPQTNPEEWAAMKRRKMMGPI